MEQGHIRNQQIRDSFDKAEGYHSAAVVQKVVANRLSDYIARCFADQGLTNSSFLHSESQNSEPRTILEIGCGTGLLTQQIYRLWPRSSFVATDYAPRMLERAQKIGLDGVRFYQMDVTHPTIEGPFDLICGNLVFQWLVNPQAVLKQLVKLLAPNGVIALSTLLKGTFVQWQKACEEEGVKAGTPDYPTLADMKAMVPSLCAGLWKHESFIYPFQSGLAFVRHLKATGASVPRDGSKPLGTAQFRRVLRRFDAKGSVVTWEVAYGCFRKPPRVGVFVTGTDTDVGKTIVSACLVRRWSGSYWKPLQTGLEHTVGDTATVQSLACNPICFSPALVCQAALAPEVAARVEGLRVDLCRLTLPEAAVETPLIVEGAGGVMVPITSDKMMIDLISLWGLPVVLVVRSGLGTLNHTLLTLEALRSRGIALAGIVLNGPENESNKHIIETRGHIRVLAEIPFSEEITSRQIDDWAQKFPAWSELFSD